LYDCWSYYDISEEQLENVVEKIIKPYTTNSNMCSKAESLKYTEGIVSAWIWYLLIMLFAIFLKGIENIIGIQLLATFVFWTWRNKKLNGG
jgi:hypothetical protein